MSLPGGILVPFHRDPPFTEAPFTKTPFTETPFQKDLLLQRSFFHRDPFYIDPLSQRPPFHIDPFDRDSPLTEKPLLTETTPSEGTWDQAQRPTPKGPWNQAVRQKETWYRDTPMNRQIDVKHYLAQTSFVGGNNRLCIHFFAIVWTKKFKVHVIVHALQIADVNRPLVLALTYNMTVVTLISKIPTL